MDKVKEAEELVKKWKYENVYGSDVNSLMDCVKDAIEVINAQQGCIQSMKMELDKRSSVFDLDSEGRVAILEKLKDEKRELVELLREVDQFANINYSWFVAKINENLKKHG